MITLNDIALKNGEFAHVADLALALAGEPDSTLRVVLTHHSKDADFLAQFLSQLGKTVYYFLDRETLPYDNYNPASSVTADRLNFLYRVRNAKTGIVISSWDAVMLRLCPPSYLDQFGFVIQRGDRLSLDTLKIRLSQAGFNAVPQVQEKGEFAVRGSILDVFAPGAPLPIRLDFFDDEVDDLRVFDVKTQLSAAKLDNIELIPSSEIDGSDTGRACLRTQLTAWLGEAGLKHKLWQRLNNRQSLGGVDAYLPLFFTETASFFDYLPTTASLLIEKDSTRAIAQIQKRIASRFEQVNTDPWHPLLPPERVYWGSNALLAMAAPYRSVQTNERTHLVHTEFKGNHHERLREVADLLQRAAVFIFAQTAGQAEIINHKLGNVLENGTFQDWDFKTPTIQVGALPASRLLKGKNLGHPGYILSGKEILGYASDEFSDDQGEADRARAGDFLEDLSLLEIGDAIVHQEHGVGRYQGLVEMQIGDINEVFIGISYANDAKLYIPVTEMEVLSRYTGASAEATPLHRLNGKDWNRAKEKAQKRIRDAATELLAIYAKREVAKTQALDLDNDSLAEFAEGFLFTPTEDQEKAFQAIYADLQREKPMDRIICGDVGFGKTEVAMRAAFAVASAGKQVAILAPTTLLVEQHGKNFAERFANYPIIIESLSRFKTDKQQKHAIEQLAVGKIDIIIGTHRLLSKDVEFKDLGLIIIDEEHKFGVKQKETIKARKADVNILTLTATPIPRTLSMSLSGLRDLSIIASAPKKRHPVNTILQTFSDSVLREGIERECARGGQVYFLHNDIATLPRIEAHLQNLFPKLQIRHAHGQMSEKALEQIMFDFYNQHFDVLLCTTIIESGIDNPNANTIFIQRADKFGLAQLHQLRGRVGRAHHQAYAYLLCPPESLQTADAQRRLIAFSSLQGLGVGFMLASQDLEIRGAGELLGEDQSGQIMEIGFSLFNKLLKQTVAALRAGESVDFEAIDEVVKIDLGVPLLIPTDYIDDAHQRLMLYKKIADCRDEPALNRIQIQLIDQYGLLPPASQALFAATNLKLLAKSLGISNIQFESSQTETTAARMDARLTLTETHQFDVDKILHAIQLQPMHYQLSGKNKLIVSLTATKTSVAPKIASTIVEIPSMAQYCEQLTKRLASLTASG